MFDNSQSSVLEQLANDVQQMMQQYCPEDFETIRLLIRERLDGIQPYCIGIKSKEWIAISMSMDESDVYLIEIPQFARGFYNHW